MTPNAIETLSTSLSYRPFFFGAKNERACKLENFEVHSNSKASDFSELHPLCMMNAIWIVNDEHTNLTLSKAQAAAEVRKSMGGHQ